MVEATDAKRSPMNQMGLQKLIDEPLRLSQEIDTLNFKLETLVLDNYRVFVDNLTCSSHLKSQEKAITDIIGKIQSQFDAIEDKCLHLKDTVSPHINLYKRNRKTLQHHMQLLEFLEIPQLVDACSRNGYFNESLELATFVNGLEKRQILNFQVNSNVLQEGGVIRSIVDEVHQILNQLRIQLLQSLCEQTSLPKELEILSTIKKIDSVMLDRRMVLERFHNPRMAALDDDQREVLRAHLSALAHTQLQTAFLEARSIWLSKMVEKALQGKSSSKSLELDDVPSHSSPPTSLRPYGLAVELLEAHRSGWQSIVTHFNALFEGGGGCFPCEALLAQWMNRQVSCLLGLLTQPLSQIEDPPSLRAVFEQALFLACRAGDVGADFTSLVVPVFEREVGGRVRAVWDKALHRLREMICRQKLEEDGRELTISLYVSPDSSHSLDASSPLHSFPPLAYFLNALLTGLNVLRECPLTSLRSPLLQTLRDVLVEATLFIIQSSSEIREKGAMLTPSSPTLSPQLDQLYGSVWSLHVLPQVFLSFESLFPCPRSRDRTLPSSLSSLQEAKDNLGSDLLSGLLDCFSLLQRGDLLPSQLRDRDPSLPDSR